jgi:hypothetical protein
MMLRTVGCADHDGAANDSLSNSNLGEFAPVQQWSRVRIELHLCDKPNHQQGM